MRKTHGYIIGALVLAIVICAESDSPAQQLEFRIGMADTSHLEWETIWLSAELTNVSNDTVRIWGFKFPGGGILKVVVTDQQGDTLQPIYERFYGDRSGFILGPGETYSEAFDLSRIFYDHKTLPPLPFGDWSGRLAPGRYEVEAEYLHRFGGKTIRTAAIPFRVIEPTGVEHQAFNLFLEAYRSWTFRNYDNTDELLAKLIADYPKSVYVERAYRKFGKDQELLEKIPDSGYLSTYLHWVLKGMSDEEQKRTFLEGIIEEHPGTRAARFAEQRLRRLERGE